MYLHVEIQGILDVFPTGNNLSVTIEDCDESKRNRIKTMSSNGTQETALNLDEIFEAYVIGNRGLELQSNIKQKM